MNLIRIFHNPYSGGINRWTLMSLNCIIIAHVFILASWIPRGNEYDRVSACVRPGRPAGLGRTCAGDFQLVRRLTLPRSMRALLSADSSTRPKHNSWNDILINIILLKCVTMENPTPNLDEITKSGNLLAVEVSHHPAISQDDKKKVKTEHNDEAPMDVHHGDQLDQLELANKLVAEIDQQVRIMFKTIHSHYSQRFPELRLSDPCNTLSLPIS